MAVKIRLKRMGANKDVFFRLVVADSRKPKEGRFIEEIGFYDPTTEPKTVKIDEDKALDWMLKGAKPSDTVRKMFSEAGLMTKLSEIKNKS